MLRVSLVQENGKTRQLVKINTQQKLFWGYNSSLTMLDSRNSSNNSNLVSENKSSLPSDNLNQDSSDLDDEIPF